VNRKRSPIWLVRRCVFGPNHRQEWRVVGLWRARNQDEAIRKAAHAVKRLAVLQAINLGPDLFLGSELVEAKQEEIECSGQ
jgi:hypothetical protein